MKRAREKERERWRGEKKDERGEIRVWEWGDGGLQHSLQTRKETEVMHIQEEENQEQEGGKVRWRSEERGMEWGQTCGTRGQKNRTDQAGELWQSVRGTKRGSGLCNPLRSKMEDNKEHCARQPRERSSGEETERGYRLYFQLRGGEGRERGELWREERVLSYLNRAGSAHGGGNSQGGKSALLQCVGVKPWSTCVPLFCVSGDRRLFKRPVWVRKIKIKVSRMDLCFPSDVLSEGCSVQIRQSHK